jgi:bacteriochlorophyllide a dehydrogenase
VEAARAIVAEGSSRVVEKEVYWRDVGDDEVLIRTEFSGVSTGTDRWVMQGRFTWSKISYPLVPGYQRVGRVVNMGSDVEGLVIGQRVAATRGAGLQGVESAWGAHTALGLSPAREVYDATDIDAAAGSLFVSAQVGVNAAARISSAKGARVVVVGDGIIGASAALAAYVRGADVLLVGHHDSRLSVISQLGLGTYNSRSLVGVSVSDFSPAAAIDTVQSDESLSLYVRELPRSTGEIVFSGYSPDGATCWADMALLQQLELTAHFVSGWTRARLEMTLDMLRTGELAIPSLISLVATGKERVNAMEAVQRGVHAHLGAVLDWSLV